MSRADRASGCLMCGAVPDVARALVLELRALTGDTGASVESVNSQIDDGPRRWLGRFVVDHEGHATRFLWSETDAAAAALELARRVMARRAEKNEWTELACDAVTSAARRKGVGA